MRGRGSRHPELSSLPSSAQHGPVPLTVQSRAGRGLRSQTSYDVTQKGHVMSSHSYPSLFAQHCVSWAIAPGQSLRHPHCPRALSFPPGGGFSVQRGPGARACRGGLGVLSHLQVPTHQTPTRTPSHSPVGDGGQERGSSKGWSWALLRGVWLTYSRTGAL